MGSPDSADQPRRRPGRPRKEKPKERDTRTVRLALRLLERVKEHQDKQREQIGYVRSISEILMAALNVYEGRRSTAVDIGMLSQKDQSRLRTIISFLAGRPKPGRKDVTRLLEVVIIRIKIGRGKGPHARTKASAPGNKKHKAPKK